MKKMQSMFAMLQSVTLRYADESSGPGRIVSVHAPSQLLPRANWSTIHNRMTRWSLYCSGGSAEPFGATTLWDMFKTIPLKLVVHCWGLSSLPQPLLLSFLLFCNPLALGKKARDTEVETHFRQIIVCRQRNKKDGDSAESRGAKTAAPHFNMKRTVFTTRPR